jgi:hypothetical protein
VGVTLVNTTEYEKRISSKQENHSIVRKKMGVKLADSAYKNVG